MATIAGDPVQGTRQIQQSTNTGTWLTVKRSTVNGREMGAQEWRGSLFLRYDLDPLDLSNYFEGCNAKFTFCNALN